MRRKTARAVVKNQDGEVLLIERFNKGEHYFVLPGGHVEAGENPKDTVLREVPEETSIQVKILSKIRSEIDGLNNEQHLYECQYLSGQPSLPQNSPEALRTAKGSDRWLPGWFKLNDLTDQVVYPSDLRLLLG